MKTIFRVEKIGDVIERFKNSNLKRGTRRNLTGRCCPECHLVFETFKINPKRLCQLCRFEKAKNKAKFLSYYEGIKNMKEFYKHYISRGIFLFNRKLRILSARNCVVKNIVVSKRLKKYQDLIELNLLKTINEKE